MFGLGVGLVVGMELLEELRGERGVLEEGFEDGREWALRGAVEGEFSRWGEGTVGFVGDDFFYGLGLFGGRGAVGGAGVAR